MKTNYIKTGLVAAAAMAAAAMTTGAQAGGDHSLTSWSEAAGKSVDKVMTYPRLALRKNEQGVTSFRVTVDRQGNVIDSDNLERANSALINSASRNVLKQADFPALPSDFEGEELTFALQLNYAIAGSSFEERALKREGRVTGREVAAARGPVTASIRILDAAD